MKGIGTPYHGDESLHDEQCSDGNKEGQQPVGAPFSKGTIEEEFDGHTDEHTDHERHTHGDAQADPEDGIDLVNYIGRQHINGAMGEMEDAAYAEGEGKP